MRFPATPGWGPLAVVVCGVRCVVCGGGVLVALWLVCGVAGPSPLLAEVPVCYSPPLLAGLCCRWWWAFLATPGGGSPARFPATPGWVSLSAVVCGVWCVVCCGGVLVGLWLVCGVVGPSPLLAEVPVCYSPPLLAGFRCRWWWAFLTTPGEGSRARFPATPGWVSLSAVVCGVWCVVCGVRRWCAGEVVAGVWCGWSLATPGGGSCVLLPATPGWVSLPVGVGVPRHSWLRVPGAVLRHSWLGFAVGGGGRSSPLLAEGPGCGSPPLLAGVRWRRWCVVCGVRCAAVCVGGVVAGVWCGWSLATPGGGSCVLLPATLGRVSLPVVVGVPRHSWRKVQGAVLRHFWLASAGGGGVWCVVCGVQRWCVGGVVAGVCCGWSLATPGGGSCVLLPATPGWASLPVVVGFPRHSWLRVPGAVPRHSWLSPPAGVVCGSPPLLAGARRLCRCVSRVGVSLAVCVCPWVPFSLVLVCVLLCLAVFVASARCCVPCVVLCCASRVAMLRCAAARCVARCCAEAFPWGGLATGRCGGHAQVSRQAKHYAHRGIIALVSCDKAFQDPCHSATREQKYVQQHIGICTHGVKTGLG